MRRRGQASIVANPVLVGAVTTLVVVVAVFLAYNANNGLPFVPTRSVNVQVDNGAELVKGNEVRSGGFRVGVITDMVPKRLPNGKVAAILKLKLDQKFGSVPVDSTVVVRPRSSLGLKYVEFFKGRSHKMIPDGGTLPISHTKVPVELDEFYNMFDAKTRAASRTNLKGFGDAFVGRGYDLNQTIQRAPQFFTGLEHVMRNLADPKTDLPNFFKQLGITVKVIAPISKTNARSFTDMATTWEAISRDQNALKALISKTPPTLDVETESLKVQIPFLAHTAAFSHDLKFAAADLKDALPSLNGALKVGVPVMQRSIQMNKDLQGALEALKNLVTTPTTIGGLRGLTDTVNTLQPQARFLGPYVTVCDYWTKFWTFNAEHFSAPDPTGGSERALLNNASSQDDGVTSQGANEFVHGVGTNTNDPTHAGVPQFLHNNTSGGYAIAPDGSAYCQKGQQGYAYGVNRFRPDGYGAYRRSVVDQPVFSPTPNFGPDFAYQDRNGKGVGLGPDRVPAGETFTQNPGGNAMQLPSGGRPNKVEGPPYNPPSSSKPAGP
jgi:virulence factor Mce-like protein